MNTGFWTLSVIAPLFNDQKLVQHAVDVKSFLVLEPEKPSSINEAGLTAA